MNPDRYAKLLKALQALETALAKDGVKRARGPLKAHVAALHADAETGGRLDAFQKLIAARSATQFLLRTVYVRVLEDLGVLPEARIRGQRGHHLFTSLAPALGYRDFFTWTFRDLAHDFPDLFAPRADELPLPGEELCKRVWDLWHQEDGRGNLLYDWRGNGFESRFLGDLYQDLDADVRERYALLQTPDFVEAYILDRTIGIALVEFDPQTLADHGATFRLIDPTCGSGHFLIGAFHRLADYWEAAGCEQWDAVTRALDGVWGCDLNPHAVHIARFRLLLEVIARTGARDLDRLGALPMHLRAMDSLIPWEGVRGQQELLPGPAAARLEKYATANERAKNAAFLGRAFHVVVGNPPYVTPKDPKKRDDYRVFWPDSAAGGYGLSAPFLERLFSLACDGGHVGQITSNSFCKRQFGVRVIEQFLPSICLDWLVDTSGAFIPGHGTPTVILIGRNMAGYSNETACILGIRGEPAAPSVPSEGRVWSDIVKLSEEQITSSAFVSLDVYPQSLFETHPWNLNGGGAVDVQRRIEKGRHRIGRLIATSGFGAVTRADDLFVLGSGQGRRFGVPTEFSVPFVSGDTVRDWGLAKGSEIVFPYYGGEKDSPERMLGKYLHVMWGHRSKLWMRKGKGFKTKADSGGQYFEYSMFYPDRYSAQHRLSFAFVSTHNHFVLDAGGKIFNRTAPIVLLDDATRDDHLDLLGLLNSSTLGFWMKQVFFNKGYSAVGGSGRITAEPWEDFYEFDATKLKQAPITETDRAPRIDLARALHDTAQQRAAALPAALLAADGWTPAALPARLADGEATYHALTARMVALQEELDWLTYRSYGLLDGHTVRTPAEIEPLRPGHRPFEIVLARHNKSCAPEERSSWFTRHGHDETDAIPDDYSDGTRSLIQQRLDLIAKHKDIRLIEQPQFKRRWQLADYAKATREAAADWLLDRLEDLFHPGAAGEGDGADEQTPRGPLAEPRPYRLEEIVNAWRRDPRVDAVAAAYAGTAHPDLAALAEELMRREAVPDNIFRVYTDEGLRKLRQWQDVWRLQDREDAGEDVGEIPLPPKFAKGDFCDARTYQLRGKLNVPRERFVLYADLRPHRFGWNGWRDTQRAVAQVEAFAEAESHPTDPLPLPTPADPRRCGATVGLWEALPDVARWGEAAEHAELYAFAAEGCQQSSCPCAVAEAWQRWAAEGEPPIERGDDAAPAEVTVEERAAVIALFQQLRPIAGQTAMAFAATELPLADTQVEPVTLRELEAAWAGSPARLGTILDDLVASGDVATRGRGQRTRYTLDA